MGRFATALVALIALCSVASAQLIFGTVGQPPPSGGSPPPSGPAVIASVSNASSDGNGIDTSGTLINSTGGTLIVASCEYYDATTDCAVGDNKSNSYTLINDTWTDGSAHKIRMYYLYSPTVGTNHYWQASCTTCYPSLQVLVINTTAGTVVDQSSGAAAAQPGSITPTANNEIVVASCESTTAGAFSINSGMTIQQSNTYLSAGNNFGGMIATITQTTAAAINPTCSGPTIVVAAQASFK